MRTNIDIVRYLTTQRLRDWMEAEEGQYDIEAITQAQSAAPLQDVYDMTPTEFTELASGYELTGA